MTKKSTSVINVAIVDDHAIVREGLKQICASTRDILVSGSADSGAEAIRMCRLRAYHVLLLDIGLADRSGIEVLKQVKQEMPAMAVLMLSIHREDQYAIRCLKAGAAGFLNKQAAPLELINAIRQTASGKKYISASLAQELANQIGVDHDTPLHESLSDREYQTMVMIASGKSVSEIAVEACIVHVCWPK